MPGVAALVVAYCTGGDVEAALDGLDCREAARGLAWLLAQMIGLTGLDPAEFLLAVKSEIIAAHLRRAVTSNV